MRLVKNAAANLARGGVGGLVAILLPALLVRHMSELSFGIWSLVLQVAAYVGYLDFGLQTAIGRYVAFANEKRDSGMRDSVVSTAFAGLCCAAVLGALFILAAACLASHIFPRVPAALLPSMRWTLIIIGFSLALGLPSSAWNGVFVGLQRYEVPALTMGGAKLLSAAAVAFVVFRGGSLAAMAGAMAAVSVASYAVQYYFFRLLASDIKITLQLVRWSTVRELGSYCFSLTVWSFSMILINGLDLLLVGRFQFGAVGSYAVASSLITFVAGAQSALFSAMMPQAAATHAQGDPEKLGRLVVNSTRIGTMILLLSGLSLFLFAAPILHAWVGQEYASRAQRLLFILLAANMLRLTWIPYSVVAVGTGQQKFLTVPPLAEGLTNFAVSVVLGSMYGAIGIAYGTLAGAVVGTLANLCYSLSRTRRQISLSRLKFIGQGVAVPCLVAVPSVLLFTAGRPGGAASAFALTIGMLIGAGIWKFTLARAIAAESVPQSG
jgi:O-antigen/teichoic acid export membrane protein